MPLTWLLLTGVAGGAGDMANLAAVPPPLPQQSANCDRPTYASDQLVCTDPQLRTMDGLYRSMLDQQGAISIAAVWEDNSLWFRRRSRCAFEAEHRDCLVHAYADRIATIEVARSSVQAASWRQVQCDGPWREIEVRVIRSETENRIVFRDNKAMLAVASPLPSLGPWLPYLGYELQGSNIALHSVAGLRINCHL